MFVVGRPFVLFAHLIWFHQAKQTKKNTCDDSKIKPKYQQQKRFDNDDNDDDSSVTDGQNVLSSQRKLKSLTEKVYS